MPAPQYVTIAQALQSSQTGLLVQDTAANIAAALPNSALTARVASFSLSANASIAAAAADTLATLGAKFQPGAAHILVQDTVAAMNAAANAAGLALATSRGIVDAAYNLLAAPAADFTNIATVTLTGSPTLSMLQLARLEALPSFSVQAGAAVLLQDSLADFVPVLSAHAAWFSSASALSVRLDGSQIGAAGVTALAALASAGKTLGFVAGATDTTLNITAAAHDLAAAAASVNQLGGLVALHITLSNDGTAVTAADAVALDSIVGYAPSAHTLTIADTAAAIAANAAALFGHGYPQIAVTSGNFTGTAAQLLDPTLQFQGAATATLTGSPTLSMAQLTRLETLPSFSVQGGAHVLLQDALTNFVPVLSAHAAWFAGASALSVRLDGGVIGAAGLTALAALETAGKTLTFVAGATDTTLNITAAAHDLATAAASVNQLGGLVGLHVTISNDGSAVTAADAVALDSITGFSAAAHTLTVADTATAIGANAAALFGHGYPQIAVASGDFIGTAAQLLDPTLAFQGNATATLSGNAAVNAAQAQSLAALPGFTLAGGATLAVADTITSLLADAGSLGAATTITATDSETVSASNAVALAVVAAAHPGHFSLGGNTLTVLDTAANLAALPQTAIALATGFALSAPATVNAAQFVTLRDTLHVGLNGQAITIDDSASHLLGLSGSLGLASACVLTGSAMVSASALQTLAGDPGFSTGGYALGVSDTAANLIALSQPLQLIASSLTLSGPQSVSASQLAALVGLGAKFTTDGYALTVTGSAADLASLNAPELALIHAAQLTQSATIGASAATALAILPNFTVGHLATLTVQDSAANLLGLPAGVLTQATEELPAGPVTLTAATAAGLAGLAHFTAIGAAITVSDTIANLTAAQNSGWQNIAGATQVVDSAAHLVAGASSALVQQAGGVAVSANASISAAQAAILNTIPNFGGGSFALTVVDGAAAIAANEAAIAHVAATATVSDSGPVNTAQADTLALLSGAGKLTFLGGDQLVVADSYGNLVAGGNTAGVALANSLTVIDTAANLITAAAHDWGSKAPTYELNDNEVVTGPQATALAALGAHFSLNTHTLAVADGAAAVAAAAPALASLGITASVTDSALNIGANIVALQGLGAELTHVQTTNITPVLGATAAALAPLAGKLTGSPLAVQDTAAGVDTSLAGLIALGAHVAVTVHDSAAAIGADATALATLGAAITVSLTDGAPVLAATAAALSPLAAHMQDGTVLAITDTGAATAAAAASLLALNASLGTITLSDGYSLTVAQAVALQPLDGHLPAGPLVTINGDAADIAANHAAIAAFVQDGHVAAVLDSNDTAAAVAANAPGLALAGATVTISDTQANLMANIATLAQNATGILQSVTVNDTAHPVFTLSISQYSEDAPILSLVSNPHAIAVIDLASAIEADLNSDDPVLTGIPGLGAISTIGHAAVVLSQSAVLFPGNATVLAHLAAPLAVTGVDIAHLTAVAALNPASIVVSDTAADIQADLASGNPLLLAHLGALHGITVSPAGTITLTPAQVLAAGVDDGIGSVFAQMSGATLDVAGATIATVTPLLGLGVAPAAIAVSDTAAHITAALTDPASAILTAANSILSLHVTDGGRIVLTEAQDLAAGVNDSAHAALAKLSGTSIEVLGVAASQLAAVEATATLPDEINLSDTAAAITAALPALLTDLANLGAITITSGTVTLSYAQAIAAHVADGAGSLVSLLPGQSYAVAGVSLAQIASLAALAQPPASYAITDSSANLAADLTAQTSQWDAHGSLVTVQGGVLALTGAQADSIILSGRTADLHDLGAGQTVEITGVSVADLANLAAVSGALQNGVTLHLDVADTAANLGADLTGGSSVLTAEAAFVNSVTLVTSNVPVTPAQLDLIAALPNLTAAILSVPVIGSAAAVDGMSQAALALAGPVSVSDTASNVQGALDTLQSVFHGGLTIHLTDATPFIGITSDTYAADQQTVDAIVNPGSVTVVGGAGAIAALEPLLAADRVVGAVQIIDSAFNVVENLPAIAALAGQATVFVTDIGAIPAYLAQALAGAGLAHLNANLLTVLDSGSQIAAMAESGTAAQTFLAAHGAILAADSSVSLLDAQALNALGGALNRNGHAVNIWDTAAHLTQPGAAAAVAALIGGGLVSGIYLEAPNNAATLTAATAVALLAIPGLSIDNPDASVNIVTVADTAAHLDSNYASLDSDLASLTHLVVDASATVGVSTLTHLQTLGATTAGGVSLTLSDTAANILSAASVNGASVQASTYNLDASASVSAPQAIALAGLANFNPGPYTLTLALNADTPVSVAQANNLATLGHALIVTGHALTLGGNVSSLSGLTQAGAAIAHVALTDTLADIAALAPGSPLLSGTIAVSDSEALTAPEATAFLALMSAAGVPAGSISFGAQTETVTDSIQALASLKASLAWTGAGAGLQAHFGLIADDTAANLANPANAAFLNTLSGQTLAATSNVSAATAAALAALSNFSRGGNGLIVSDSAANLLAPAAAAGVALATSVTLNTAASLNTAGAESLLQLNHFHLTQGLTITDNSANLLDGTLSGLIAGHTQVAVALAGAETLDAQTAAALVSLQGFSDTTDMHIVDSSSYLLAPAATAAEAMAASVSLNGNEIVSANTVLRLSEIPHFTDSGGTLTLAGSDFANAPTLKAIADLGTNFSEGGHALSLTQNDLALTPTEFAAINADTFLANGHIISAAFANGAVTDTNNLMSFSATGVAGATVNIYNTGGGLVWAAHEANASFTVTAPDVAGSTFSITETVNGVESAPVVVLDQAALENAVTLAAGSFANTGEIQVDSGKFINLYTLGAQLPNAPALVYDPAHHTISLDIPNALPVTLITLGASTTPASIDPTEIIVKHHS